MFWKFSPFITFKPIFHHNVNPFALGSHVGLDPQCDNFALSLYSTATRNHLRWVFALGTAPNVSDLRCRYQYVGIWKASWTQHKAPRTQHEASWTQRELTHKQVKYRSRWIPLLWGSYWTCTFQPIFYHNAKPLALGLRVGYGPQRKGFALLMPTCCVPNTTPNTSQ